MLETNKSVNSSDTNVNYPAPKIIIARKVASVFGRIGVTRLVVLVMMPGGDELLSKQQVSSSSTASGSCCRPS